MTNVVDPEGPKLAVLPTNPVPEGVRVGYFTTPDKVRIRYAIFPKTAGAAKGTVCLVQGRTEFIEKYFETIADFQKRGFAVATFDWRGQGLSNRKLRDRQKGHIDSYDEYISDLEGVISHATALSGNGAIYILAHSMGGHIALRAMACPIMTRCWSTALSTIMRFR